MHEVETKVLNQSVKRNPKRFLADFMFQLTSDEFESLKTQMVISNDNSLRSQIVTLKKGRGQHLKYLPYAFTEHGIAMLSSVINSEKAIDMNIAIMRAFVATRKILIKQGDLKEQINELRERIGEHDTQLNQIYDAMENLLDENAAKRKWDGRKRIGFKNDE